MSSLLYAINDYCHVVEEAEVECLKKLDKNDIVTFYHVTESLAGGNLMEFTVINFGNS